MKNLYALALGLVGLVGTTHAQSELKFKTDAESFFYHESANLKNSESFATAATRGKNTCTDTTRWAYARSFANSGGTIGPTYYEVLLHNEANVPNSYGTYVDVPTGTSIEISGFSLYGRSLRGDNGSVNVNAVLYSAGSDSLPTGAALATVAVKLDTTTSNFIRPMLKKAVFTTPVTVNGSFVIVVEGSTTVGDSISLLRGFTGSGTPDNFPAIYKIDGFNGGNYTRLHGTNFGARLPHFYPFVSFEQTNDFNMSVAQLSTANESVDFTYSGPSILGHPVWSFSGYANDTTSHWSYNGGTSFDLNDRDHSHTFADENQDYDIVLHDSISLWRAPQCVITETKTLKKKDKPNSVLDVANGKFVAYATQGQIFTANAIGKARLFNLTGSVVKEVELTNQFDSFNVSDLNEGVYILEVNEKAVKLKL